MRLHGATVPVETFGPLVSLQRFLVAAECFERFSASPVSGAECGPELSGTGMSFQRLPMTIQARQGSTPVKVHLRIVRGQLDGSVVRRERIFGPIKLA